MFNREKIDLLSKDIINLKDSFDIGRHDFLTIVSDIKAIAGLLRTIQIDLEAIKLSIIFKKRKKIREAA